MDDLNYMKLALNLAQQMKGQTTPNPAVGAIVVNNGEIVGLGSHLKAGDDHAEVHALKMAGSKAANGTLYVTLEPCSHYGKTPPCTEAIIDYGINRVVVAMEDPNPLVAGNGIKLLRNAGIQVETNVGKQLAEEINVEFCHFMKTGKPYVTLKAGLTFDGKIATKSGDSKWITSEEARIDVHKLRHQHDAILVGINTVLSDNPHLTTRLPLGGNNPIRVILDSNLKTPIDANIITDQSARTIIFTLNHNNQAKITKFEANNVEVIPCKGNNIEIDFVLDQLAKREITSVLVEGGSNIHASFINNNYFQQIIFYLAPKIVGGQDAIPVVGGKGVSLIKKAPKLKFVSYTQIGPDLKIVAKPIEMDVM